MATIPSGLVGKQESAVTKTLEGLGFEVKTDKVLGGLFGTVRTVKSGDTDLSNGGKIRLRDANGNPTVSSLCLQTREPHLLITFRLLQRPAGP